MVAIRAMRAISIALFLVVSIVVAGKPNHISKKKKWLSKFALLHNNYNGFFPDDDRFDRHPDFSVEDAAADAAAGKTPTNRASPDEKNPEFWNNMAKAHLLDRLEQPINTNKAKNIIMFLGDGMSLTTVAATRMYLGGEEESLSFEKFPHFGLSKVGVFVKNLLVL